MPYSPLKYEMISDRNTKKIFLHANSFLFDTFNMFDKLPNKGGGGGNFSIVLVLLCIIDGFATEIWPRRELVSDQEQRFKQLIRDRLPWGPEGKEKWLNKGIAADQLYTEFRNPLTHELGKDKPATSRFSGFGEPLIGKWDQIPPDMQDISKIDALPIWNEEWPILRESKDSNGSPCLKLNAAAFYWAVKVLAKAMAAEAL